MLQWINQIKAAWQNDRVVVFAWGIAFALLTLGLIVAIYRLKFVHVVTGEWTISVNELRDIVLTVAAVIGFPIVIQRTRAHDKQAAASHQQANTDSRRRLAEAHAKAVELFASAELSVRLGGLYALWSLAQESVDLYHVQVMEILCAFVRNPSPLIGYRPDGSNVALLGQHPDIGAILALIRARDEKQCARERTVNYILNFRAADIRNANFRDANLQGANFHQAKLTGAFFERANLQSASFAEAILYGVDFGFADLREGFLTNVKLNGSENFENAALNGTAFWGVDNGIESVYKGIVLIDKNRTLKYPNHPEKNLGNLTQRKLEEWKFQRDMLRPRF